jgi:ATP-dependent DNA helicase PIF1
MMESGRNVFLTGRAGTGKSYTVSEFVRGTGKRVAITATTGIAAVNLQDNVERLVQTIYGWAGIFLGPAEGQEFEDYYRYLCREMGSPLGKASMRASMTDTLIIDEVSMLPGRTLDYLDFHLRKLRDKPDRPFGGIQIIAVGDFLQLPPVAKNRKYDWAFKSRAWGIAGFKVAMLTTIHRQASDAAFTAALNSFREGKVTREVADLLASRVGNHTPASVTRLMTHNTQVDRWNNSQMAAIEEEEQTFDATFSGNESQIDAMKKRSLTPITLKLKPTCRVMVTANVSDGKGGRIAANGDRGVMVRSGNHTTKVWNSTDEEYQEKTVPAVFVLMDSGDEIAVPQFVWQFDPQDKRSAKMKQFPLRPAWAMTIHKSQGLSLDSAHIDIRAAIEPGQAYVALSRLRTLKGLHLKEWIKCLHVSDDAINFYKNLAL